MTLLPILRFGMDKDNHPCGICNCELEDKPCDRCDLCRSKYHSSCLQWLADHPSNGESQNLDCPRCDGSLGSATAQFLKDTRGTQAPSASWEHFSIPANALDPPLLPEAPAHSTAGEARAMIACPPPGGYVKIFAKPLEFVDDWYGQAVSSREGISRLGDNVPWLQLACARWHFLKTVAGPAMKQELIPFLVDEARYQQATDLASSSFNISWRILEAEAAQRVFGAGVLGLIFRAGTEAGLLGLHDQRLAVYATDGSLEDNIMGAGVYVAHSHRALSAKIGRSSEARTSLRVETGASFLALENGKDTPAPIFILTDSANQCIIL